MISSFNGGGAERVLLTVLHGLHGYTQALAVGDGGTLLPLVPSVIPVHQASTERELAAVMAAWQPDVVHTWLDGSLLTAILPAAHLGIPIIHRLCNISSAMAAQAQLSPRHKSLMAQALGTATRVCALSSAAADDAAAYYGIVKPQVIANGFPLAGARGLAMPVAKSTVPIILAVGRLSAEKGHANLIRAVALLAGEHPSAELWIAGVGACETELRELAESIGLGPRTRFLGFREDIAALHAAADVFVCPSLTEGFGNAVAEALIAGLPVIAPDLSAIRADVLSGRPGALLVPPGDVDALAMALARLLSDPAARLALAHAGRQASAGLRAERMLEQYQALYDRVVEDADVAA